MSKRKIMAVFGTRPEAIKLAPVIKELKGTGLFETAVVVTAQHREMLDGVLALFEITPDYDLNIMEEKQELFDITVKSLKGLNPILRQEEPDFLLVQGDTTTTLAAALSAFYLKIPIGHVEAGLRTFKKYQPFPEEMNRQLTSLLSDLCFAPTEVARGNLLAEGVNDKNIFVTGNTVIDALLSTVKDGYIFNIPELRKIDFDSRRVVLVTVHRRESWGEPLQSICKAIRKIAEHIEDIEVIFSLHPNPVVKKEVQGILGNKERIYLLDALDYETFVNLMNRCYLVLTDSGGIQEEAPSLGKPVLVLRKVTERPEAIKAGTAKLAGIEEENIVKLSIELLTDATSYEKMARASNPYGDGNAAKRITEVLEKYFSK